MSTYKRMKCWHCNNELIWMNDHDNEDIEGGIITYLNCLYCPTTVEVHYTPDDTPPDDGDTQNKDEVHGAAE